MNYTLVIGVDDKHLERLKLIWPTWAHHKPSLLKHPRIVFYDLSDPSPMFSFMPSDTVYVRWPQNGTDYPTHAKELQGNNSQNARFFNPQRYKMLSGFVHVPALYVTTPYWLKLDLDVVATGQEDWIQESWFGDRPAIVSHPWSYTKPPDQMAVLDRWVEDNAIHMPALSERPALNLLPRPGSDLLSHKRIISWCAFFSTGFTSLCAHYANVSEGRGLLPVPSQDGYMWYIAARMGLPIVRTNMKQYGWAHWSTMRNVRKAVEEAMKN